MKAGSLDEQKTMADLFSNDQAISEDRPLADRMRPATLGDFSGQLHLLEDGKPLRRALDQARGRRAHPLRRDPARTRGVRGLPLHVALERGAQ